MPVAAEPAPYWTPYTPQPEPAPDYSQYAQGQPQQGGYYTITTPQQPYAGTEAPGTAPQQPYYAPDAYAANAQQQPQQSYYDYSAAAAGAAPQQPYQQNAQIPPQQPYYYPQAQPVASKDRIAAGLLGIFLGWAGVHKFYLGYNAQGFIMLAVSIVGGIFTIGLAWGVIALIGLIEGIMYLTKSQGEFEHTYVLNKREWF
jgi:TM2 domain-containing membrane protein YozV